MSTSKLNREEAVGTTKKSSELCSITQDGLLRIGGHLINANLPAQAARPIILPHKQHLMMQIIIREPHVCVSHMGGEATLANIRQK